MTVEDVVSARDAVVARGERPSQRAVLAELGRGSKRDVARLLKLAQEPPAAPEPDPEVLAQCENVQPVDPVSAAAVRLREAETQFEGAREALLEAKIYLLATRNLAVEGVLHGSLHAADEVHQQAVDDVDDCKRHYDRAWQQRADARLHRDQMEQQHRKRQQERWVATHQPELVQQLDHWAERLRLATSDHQHAHAKKEHGAALFAYHQAVARAPWTTNGHAAGAP